MTKTILAAIGVSAAIMMGSSASAGTIADFVNNCGASPTDCRSIVSDIIVNGRDSHYICLPKDLGTMDAAHKEIDWLRDKVGRDQHFAARDEQDAMWAGAHALWPCRKHK